MIANDSRVCPYALHNGVYVLQPRKDLMGGEETRELGRKLNDIVEEAANVGGQPYAVVDLGAISFLNNTGLGALVAGHVQYKKREGRLVLARSTRRITNLFLITKLGFVLDSYEDNGTAVEEIETLRSAREASRQ